MMLPERFTESILKELGEEEGSALCAALETLPPVSLRIHPSKGRVPNACEQIPWSPFGYYLNQRPLFTLDPAFHGGCYYVQEASSQFVGHLLADVDLTGRRVLDLCAAPGGKATLYASLVGSEGLVVANEVNRQRAQVLADNVRKWGTGNILVTIEEASRVAEFEDGFDVVAVDAPCSGEGMFRKAEEARAEWSEGNVTLCAVRQGELLREAWRALKPGGLLIYSTCTFNRTEDEEVLEKFSLWAEAAVVRAHEVTCERSWGIVCGTVGGFQTFRFFPHRTKGEGFFIAVARKAFDAGGRARSPKARRSMLTTVDKQSRIELERWVLAPQQMQFALIGDTYYGYYCTQMESVKRLAEALNVIYSGVAMGQLFKGRLKPDPALAFFCGLNREALPEAPLETEEALNYLRRKELSATLFTEGMNLVTAEGVALGFAKRIGGRVNNLYPNALRILNK
ncbi:MAG: SAM-dependent methyltransferase [Alistipes sp.]